MLERLFEGKPGLRRWGRYVVTSVVATLVSESVLLVLYGLGLLGATTSAVVANLAGTVPSYLMSRSWIWPESDRDHPARQMTSYWLISVASLVVSSALTGLAADHAPASHAAHLVVVGIAYVGTYGALWLGKFALYQFVVFRRPVADAAPEGPEGRTLVGDTSN